MYCGEWSAVKEDETGGVAVTLRCNSWLCPDCQPTRRAKLIILAEQGTPNRFITLTASPRVGVSATDRAHRLARAWRLVVARAKRQLGLKTLEYLAVFEQTKRGEPHLHILVRSGYIDQRWLSNAMRNIMASPIVDIRAVKDPRRAALYLAKYIGKAPHHFGTCKRYWHTANWVTADRVRADDDGLGTDGWRPVQKDLPHLLSNWKSFKWYAWQDGTDRVRYINAPQRGPPAEAVPRTPATG